MKTEEERIRQVWGSMIGRCYKDYKNTAFIKNYRELGITVCDEWQDEEGYENFRKWYIENGGKPGMVLDRKNTYLGYSPDNCRVVSVRENCRNRTDTIFVRHNGKVVKLVELSDQYGIRHGVVYGRLKNGWDLERALTTPVRQRKPNKNTGVGVFTERHKRDPISIAIPYKEAISEYYDNY